jgi:hypothetical protein
VTEPNFLDTLRIDPKVQPQAELSSAPDPLAADPFASTSGGYIGTAVARELDALRTTAPGGRNGQLNVASGNLGQLIGAGLDEMQLRADLRAVAREIGLDDHEIGPTIDSGIGFGKRNPRSIPERRLTLAPAPWEDGPDDEWFWESRPELAHVRQFARARLCSPLATLSIVLARVVTSVPHFFTLPPIIGGDASLNLFAAIVAASGHGKGTAEAAARDAVLIDGISQFSLGSGEGISRTFAHREKAPDDEGRRGGTVIVRDHWALLFSVPEVDTLTALGARQGATLLPQVRQAYSGESLGFAYSDPQKAITIPAHEYRLCLILGVQPGRASALLDDVDGGTPQRFLWVPAADPGAPDHLPEAPTPMAWELPDLSSWGPPDPRSGRRRLGVPEVAREAIVSAAQARNRGQVDALDGHALLTRLKVAAALALFARRTGVKDEDWHLSGHLMDVSDRTRAEVVAHLRARSRDANTARGELEADRAVVVADKLEAARAKRVGPAIVRALARRADWMTRRDIAAAITSLDRPVVDEVLAGLVAVGTVEESQDDGSPRMRYRLASAA